jgi:hypothetical protein
MSCPPAIETSGRRELRRSAAPEREAEHVLHIVPKGYEGHVTHAVVLLGPVAHTME